MLLGCLLPFLAWLTRRTTITTRRIILRSGVFARVRRELLHSRGYDVVVRRIVDAERVRLGRRAHQHRATSTRS